MSKKDFLKGIEAQAKIQAKREQKVEKGMQVLEEKLEDIAEGQDAGFELVDVVLHDVADMQNQALYGLTSGKQLKDLEYFLSLSELSYFPEKLLFRFCQR